MNNLGPQCEVKRAQEKHIIINDLIASAENSIRLLHNKIDDFVGVNKPVGEKSPECIKTTPSFAEVYDNIAPRIDGITCSINDARDRLNNLIYG
jgi:TFIIF-interacting CTD phosphatase-like protein